jgi:N-acyl-D-aspartate/D-glutamate deacylase
MRRMMFAAGLVLLVFVARGAGQTDALDLLIVGGRIVDGAGNPWFRADVGIRGGRIVDIGQLASRPARQRVDARDRIVSPGFIDMMAGSSVPLVADPPSAESKLRQGITTILVGEGGSVAPQNERTMRRPDDDDGLPITWRTFAEYFKLVELKRIALNVVHNVGAAQVRRVVVGDENQRPTSAQLDEMRRLVAQAMQDGAVGVSSALIYPPGTYATTEELIELAKVAAQYHGIYLTHMRNESGGVLDAIRETIRIGEEAHLPVHIYHLKAAGQANWRLMTDALALIADTRARGVDITADIYPYIRNGIGLGSFLNPRHYARGTAPFLQTLGDAALRRELRREVETTSDWENWYQHVGRDWDNVLITSVGARGNKEFVGLSVKQVAQKRGIDEWDAFFDLVQGGGIGVAPKSMNEDQKREALRAPFISVDTDSAPTNPASVPSAHPRAFGTFARIIQQYVIEEHVIPLEEAVRKMTSLPANRLMLHDRGRIALGMSADLLVYDPRQVKDTATYAKPLSFATGIDCVVINGELVIDEGKTTGAKPGILLRHTPSQKSSSRGSTP